MSTESRYTGKRKWVVAERPPIKEAAEIAASLGVSFALGRLLYIRGCRTANEARAFIRRETGALHDPYRLPDMAKATAKIKEALSLKKKIIIYGDYDVDGVTSVSVLYLYLSELGANVEYYIPKRSGEGYGMSAGVIRRMIEEGAGLIITVDTGITAIEEVKLANELGCDVVVTDHHECREELPLASAVVNPQRHDSEYPFRELAGVGVVYKLICALEAEIRENGNVERAVLSVSNKYIDLVAIGTVADVMPVRDENRLIVSYGLSRIENTERCGLSALMEASASQSPNNSKPQKKSRITSGYISYTIAPRINAVGRISDAALAVELFLTDDHAKARELANELCRVNRERQSLENVIAEEAYAKVEASHDFSKDPVIVLHDEKWHNGIIGIVASRVTEKYGTPSILISFEGNDGAADLGKGSGRSVKGLNLVEALGECGEYLEKYGGHELAAGLTVRRDRLDAFREALNESARRKLALSEEEPTIVADDELSFSELDLSLAEELLLLEPYGVGNLTPVYLTRSLYVKSVIGVGANKHTRLTLTENESSQGKGIMAMCFSSSPEEIDIHAGEYVDVMYNLDINEFRGDRSAQLLVRAIRKTEDQLKTEAEERELYNSIKRCDDIVFDYDLFVPERDDFAAVFRMLRHEINMGRGRITARGAVALVEDVMPMNYVKMKLILDIFSEMNILYIEETEPDIYRVRASQNNEKVQLDKSNILRRIRSKFRYK